MKATVKSTGLDSVEVNVLKGILICLIILGHNKVFTAVTGLFSYLYTFHVVCFFMLSVLLNDSPLTTSATIKKIRDYFYPYTIFFILLAVINVYWSSSRFNYSIGELFFSYISADISTLRPVTGFVYLWFMPAIFCCYALTAAYNCLGYNSKIISWFLLILLAFIIEMIPNEYKQLIPFAIPTVIFILPIALFLKYQAIKLTRWKYYWLVALVGVLFLSQSYYHGGVNIPSEEFPLTSVGLYLKYFIFICSMFLLLHYFSRMLRHLKLLSFIGLYSLEIYLIHNPINFFIVDVICGDCHHELLFVQKFSFAIVVFLVTLFLSILLAWFLSNNRYFSFLFRYKY